MTSVPIQATPIAPLPTIDTGRLTEMRAGFGAVTEMRDAFVAHDRAAGRLSELMADGAWCVTTGQQPGLYTGPLFTIYKALAAVALAERLENEIGAPVIPVFWVAGDDHDVAEANHLVVADVGNQLQRLELAPRDPDDPLTPLYRTALGARLVDTRNQLEAALPDTEFRPDVLEWLDRHYRPDQDYATAFAHALAELLGPFGVVVFQSTSVNAKRAMVPYFRQVLAHAGELDAALAAHTERLTAAGQPAPVHVGDGAAPMMLEAHQGRDRLTLEGQGFATRRSGEQWTLEQLDALAAEAPQRLSPNVLLRPVIEAAILPTLSYVAGPGELAYLPQCAPLYEALHIPPQLPVPRWSGRMVETKIQKVLDKYALSPEDLDGPEGSLEGRLARNEMPEAAATGFQTLRSALQESYTTIEEAAATVDPTMRKAVRGARNTSLAAARDVEKRLVAHLKSQNEILTQQIGKARTSLYPMNKPQERVFGIVQYLVRYGPALLQDLHSACRQWYGVGTGAPRP